MWVNGFLDFNKSSCCSWGAVFLMNFSLFSQDTWLFMKETLQNQIKYSKFQLFLLLEFNPIKSTHFYMRKWNFSTSTSSHLFFYLIFQFHICFNKKFPRFSCFIYKFYLFIIFFWFFFLSSHFSSRIKLNFFQMKN